MNYTLGANEKVSIINNMPTSGGYILIEEDAAEGMSGSIVVIDKDILGMIIASSNITESGNNKKSFSLAVDMYYLLPHIIQCVTAIDKYTYNNPLNLVNLCKYTTMKTFTDDLKPVVLHLGGDYIFRQLTSSNLEKHILLLNIHNFLEVDSLWLLQENLANSIKIKTTLNSNDEFLEYFFDKQESSEVIIKSANYWDKVANRRIDIDFVKDPLYANILDWCFRGDPDQYVIFNVQTRTFNNDGSITLSDIRPFTFNSSPVVDTINNQSTYHTNLEIPGFFFEKNNAIITLMNSFNMSLKLNFLSPTLRPINRPVESTLNPPVKTLRDYYVKDQNYSGL